MERVIKKRADRFSGSFSPVRTKLQHLAAGILSVQDTLKYVPGARRQTRQETVTNLLMNDSRNGQPRTWILKKKRTNKEERLLAEEVVGTNSKMESYASQSLVSMFHMNRIL